MSQQGHVVAKGGAQRKTVLDCCFLPSLVVLNIIHIDLMGGPGAGPRAGPRTGPRAGTRTGRRTRSEGRTVGGTVHGGELVIFFLIVPSLVVLKSR